jgi:hypothetical protein
MILYFIILYYVILYYYIILYYRISDILYPSILEYLGRDLRVGQLAHNVQELPIWGVLALRFVLGPTLP